MGRVYLVFRSTHETLKAESVLAVAGLPCKVVVKPASIRLDCGLAVRTDPGQQDTALAALRQAGLEPRGVFNL
ncbi:DUF3343 domain-containing protein [Caldinitratiruptor microaerophilus]|uniref:Putative Se/S carrier protein-like domain-containing protein n=1 Tax=Caldinitratiruptor microaerophilus TaxID=671077 RepID=A0AA35CIW8_9FIRM|nr:DUF3343 domain-containing protein [Caldinitratiruptor microaerophilus]BDG60074.1 hypothetical protein caldi_11640 [Caldinitratiruptor microaerophilus]